MPVGSRHTRSTIDTCKRLINLLLKREAAPQEIPAREFDNMFVVTIPGRREDHPHFNKKYGDASQCCDAICSLERRSFLFRFSAFHIDIVLGSVKRL